MISPDDQRQRVEAVNVAFDIVQTMSKDAGDLVSFDERFQAVIYVANWIIDENGDGGDYEADNDNPRTPDSVEELVGRYS